MPLFRGWYSQDGWRTKLVLINRVDEPANLRIKLFRGEDGPLLASFRLRLKPKEIRFYSLDRVKRVAGEAGIVLIDSDKPVFCGGHLINLKDEMKVLDYRLPRIDEPQSCC
ncbi:MAG TPA: hypothetical protein ENG52_01465 [Nitrososphaeria archaeon]|nr:hypothetical protein [Nitrososphaeria archaeon]